MLRIKIIIRETNNYEKLRKGLEVPAFMCVDPVRRAVHCGPAALRVSTNHRLLRGGTVSYYNITRRTPCIIQVRFVVIVIFCECDEIRLNAVLLGLAIFCRFGELKYN